jgi:hypothetical protein
MATAFDSAVESLRGTNHNVVRVRGVAVDNEGSGDDAPSKLDTATHAIVQLPCPVAIQSSRPRGR